jgi:hypothetical protein
VDHSGPIAASRPDTPTAYVTLVVYAPIEDTERVRVAMCDAGAGTVDDGRHDRVATIAPARCITASWTGRARGQESRGKNTSLRKTVARADAGRPSAAVSASRP